MKQESPKQMNNAINLKSPESRLTHEVIQEDQSMSEILVKDGEQRMQSKSNSKKQPLFMDAHGKGMPRHRAQSGLVRNSS